MVVLFMAACSRKKNTFLSRTKQSVTSEFNILYNGNIAFKTGKEQLARTYRDNFWETLPIERIEIEESNTLIEESITSNVESVNENFNIAEEKAVKAIQMHSIYIEGKEYNPQIDEAYILLGKARYFDGRFVQALDAFNFILKTHPISNNINQAKVWRAKTQIRLNNEEVAIENLLKMNKYKELNREDLADASAILAQAYINLDSIEAAMPYIRYASENVKDDELKGRYTYILGQLYDQLEKTDSANLEFDKVIALNRKSPRVYMINAYIEKARNFDFTNEDRVAFLALLFDLEENRENRPFLDKIYNQIGEYYRKNDSIDLAVEYYNKSIQAYQEDRVMQSVNYQTLAEIYFDDRYYKFAGAYYDSTLTNLDEGTRSWRRIKKKRENLDDVIKYEDIAFENDSVLKLVNMTEAQQLSYFSIYTTQLKQKAIEDSLARIENEENISNNEFFTSNKEKSQDKTGGSSFYFYNSTTIAFGKQEFEKRWGKRRLEDNWRLSDKISKLENFGDEVASPIAENNLYKPETYLALIPKDEKAIDSLIRDRDFAYYQLGLIYKEKFKEYDLATERLEALLLFNPEKRLVLPTLYNLHKINQLTGNEILAALYKNEIITRYPDSRYAEILLNPNAILATDASSPEYKYSELYKDFEASKYQKVIETSETCISIYFGNPIIPKFELLKANAIGRQQGYKSYKRALAFVSLSYPSSEEGKEALALYNKLLPKIANKVFLSDSKSERWKVAYSFNSEDREAAEKLQEKLNKAIESNGYTEMSTSIDYYIPNTIFVMTHGLNSRQGAEGFADVLSERKKDKIKNNHFEVSSENYAIIQIHKNLEDYLAIDFSKTLIQEEEKDRPRLKVEKDEPCSQPCLRKSKE